MNNFQPGHNCPVRFQVLGQGPVSLLNVTSHNLDLSVLLYDTTHTGNLGNTSRTVGKRDAAATVSYDIDADAPPYLNPPLIIDGVSGFFLFYYSALTLGRPLQVPMTIEKVHYEMQIGSQTKGSFDAKLNGHIGVIVYPGL